MAQPNLSNHIPDFAGGELDVTGEARIDTGLRQIQGFSAVIKASNFVPNEEGKVSWYRLDGDPAGVVVLRVEKTGANDGILGDNTVTVSWMALGK